MADEPFESLRWWKSEVVDTAMETPHVRSLTLAVPGWLGHTPGQYVDVRHQSPSGHWSARSYSIASPSEDGERVAITVEYLVGGVLSPYLVTEVGVGDEIDICGPLGPDFSWQVKQGGPLLLIGGGSGIVPLMAMLRHRARTQAGLAIPVRLLYSARSLDEVIYRDALSELASQDPELRISYTLTRESSPDGVGYRRRIDAEMMEEVAWPASSRPLTYIAGPTTFVERAAGLLLDLGYDTDRLYTEWFSPS